MFASDKAYMTITMSVVFCNLGDLCIHQTSCQVQRENFVPWS
jgi:hypothetical protein